MEVINTFLFAFKPDPLLKSIAGTNIEAKNMWLL